VIAISRFGASAPAKQVFEELGFSVENVVRRARMTLGLEPRSDEVSAASGSNGRGPTKQGVDEK
jgi:hypothetical protein